MTATASNFVSTIIAYSEELGRDVALVVSHITSLRWSDSWLGGPRLVASAQGQEKAIEDFKTKDKEP